MSKKRFKLIDCFSGAGGMSLGFSDKFGNAFDSIWASDFNKYCAMSYNANFGEHCLCGDIKHIVSTHNIKIPQADVVIGGPPCQGFSILNQNRSEKDERRALWQYYFDVVEKSRAKIFVMENVPPLLKEKEYDAILKRAEQLGFYIWKGILHAVDYGVAQTRKRLFTIGCRFFKPPPLFPPRQTHFDPVKIGKKSNKQAYKTVYDVIGDLPIARGTRAIKKTPPLNLHYKDASRPYMLFRYHAIPEEGMTIKDLIKSAPHLSIKSWKEDDRYLHRLWWNRPCCTIVAGNDHIIHPAEHRELTLRERARIQSFPDDFIFKGPKMEIKKQIGNAVPPLLAAQVAKVVYRLLLFSEDRKSG